MAARNDLRRLLMRQNEILEDILRQARRLEGLGETLADQDRLRRMLEDDSISRHQRRDNRIDRGEIGIVPRRDGENDAQRLTLDITQETFLGFGPDVGARTLGDPY